jgi:tetratricopeptide (TPR) repeat protein
MSLFGDDEWTGFAARPRRPVAYPLDHLQAVCAAAGSDLNAPSALHAASAAAAAAGAAVAASSAEYVEGAAEWRRLDDEVRRPLDQRGAEHLVLSAEKTSATRFLRPLCARSSCLRMLTPTCTASSPPPLSSHPQVRACASRLCSGEYDAILSSPFARAVLRPLGAGEGDAAALGTGMGPSGPFAGASPALVRLARAVRERAYEAVCQLEADGYADDGGGIDTPQHTTALGLVLVAAACLALFAQANYTGPDLPVPEGGGDGAGGHVARVPLLASVLLRASEGAGATAASSAAAAAANPAGQAAEQQEEEEEKEEEGLEELPTMSGLLAPLTPLHRALLTSLRVDGFEAYEMVLVPEYLVAARAILLALCPPSSGDVLAGRYGARRAAAAAADADAPDDDDDKGGDDDDDGRPSGEEDAAEEEAASEALRRGKKLGKVVDSLYLARWLAGRCAEVHQRSLVDREPSVSLWRECRGHFARAAAHLLPGLDGAFLDTDRFDASLLARPVERGLSLALRSVGPDEAADLRARFALEWGMAQHFFGKATAAKASFLIAKREVGLRARLTGALGKRTKYQQFSLSQLVLRARGRDRAEPEGGRAAAAGAAAAEAAAEGAAPAALAEGVAAASSSVDEPAAVVPTTSMASGVRSVQISEVDADTYLLETIAFTKPGEEDGGDAGTAAPAAAAAAAAPAADTAPAAAEAAPADDSSSSSPFPSSPSLFQVDDGDVEDGPLGPLEQCVVLALSVDINNHSPADGLTQEQMRPFVARVLEDANAAPAPAGARTAAAAHSSPRTPHALWLTHSTALLLKSLLESENYRLAERAVLQLQALVDQHTNKLTVLQSRSDEVERNSAPAAVRLSHLFCLAWPPRWDLQRQCADRYRKLGAGRAALALYEELALWDDIIQCYVAMDRVKRAAKLVRQRLAVDPTPYLYCILGVVTDADEPFRTAIEVAGGKYPKADLALGRRMFQRAEFDAAGPLLRKGLRGCPGADKEWYLLGVLSMRGDDYPGALEAFSRVVQLDSTRADAWSNLGAIHLQLKSWTRGYSAYEQALRADKRDWRVWSNFLVACIRIKNYSRAITVMHTLVDLYKQKATGREGDEGGDGVDIQCLGVLVTEVVKSMLEQKERDRVVAEGREAVEEQAREGARAGGGEGGSIPAPEAPQSSSFVAPPPPLSTALFDEEDESGAGDASSSSAPASSASAEAAPLVHVDIGGSPASVHLDKTAKLLGHITSAISRAPAVWGLYAILEDARGRLPEALECRLRQCRAIQAAGWEKVPEAVLALASASRAVVRDYQRVRQGTRDGADAAAMHVRTLLGRIEAAEVCVGCEGHEQLKRLLEGIPTVGAGEG